MQIEAGGEAARLYEATRALGGLVWLDMKEETITANGRMELPWIALKVFEAQTLGCFFGDQ